MNLLGRKSESGFTLMELLVVIFIIGIITTVVIVSFRSGDKRKTLKMGVEEVTTLIKDAQNRSLLGQTNKEGNFPAGGYGVYLGLNQGYAVLFQDEDSDQKYTGPKTYPFEGGEKAASEYVSHVKIREGLAIDKIFKDGKVLREVAIVFVPPKPTMYFDSNNDITAGEIVFTMEEIKDKREIFLNCLSGQIDVRSSD